MPKHILQPYILEFVQLIIIFDYEFDILFMTYSFYELIKYGKIYTKNWFKLEYMHIEYQRELS